MALFVVGIDYRGSINTDFKIAVHPAQRWRQKFEADGKGRVIDIG